MALMNQSCPGSRAVKSPHPEYVNCKHCGTELEIWSDESKVTCPKCLTIYFNEQNLACVEWCSFAKECVGEETYQRLMGNRKPGADADRDEQVAKARARLKALIESGKCRVNEQPAD